MYLFIEVELRGLLFVVFVSVHQNHRISLVPMKDHILYAVRIALQENGALLVIQGEVVKFHRTCQSHRQPYTVKDGPVLVNVEQFVVYSDCVEGRLLLVGEVSVWDPDVLYHLLVQLQVWKVAVFGVIQTRIHPLLVKKKIQGKVH